MADKSFATAPAGTGFDRYAAIVAKLLTIHQRIRDSIYDPEDDGGSGREEMDDILKIIANLTDTGQSTPTGYNLDPLGGTQTYLLPPMSNSSQNISAENARKIADGIIRVGAGALQIHLVKLIQESDTYADIDNYYDLNQTQRSSVANVLNGGYHFTAEWNRLSTSFGVPYDTDYDID